MHDRQRTRREPADAVRVEDVIPAEILNDTRVDREYLELVFREPQKFLPPRVKQEPDVEPKPAEPPQQPESRLARRAKLTGLVAAATLVAGAIIIASTATSQHRNQAANDTGSREIIGAAALGGFAVPDPPGTDHDGDGRSTKPHTKQPSVQQAADTEQNGSESAPATPTPTTPHVLVPTTAFQKLEAVKKFYELVDLAPEKALSMLAPVLAAEEPGELVRAWSSMDAVQVQDAEVQPDGSVLAIVTMRQPDGSHLRITQLLRLAEDASGLISDARLLSFQRM